MSQKPSRPSVFNELRLQGRFCDAVLQTGGCEFAVHKVIMCNCSPYFRTLFQHWAQPDRRVFTISEVSPDMMKLILEFAYTGSVTMTKENVRDLLLAADQLNVMDIMDVCFHFLQEQICAENCIGIWQFAKNVVSAEVQSSAYRYILQHFDDVVVCDEFQQLSAHELGNIIDKDELNVKTENAVFEAVLLWIGHAPDERNQHVAELLSKVRLAQTSVEYITNNVASNALVRSNSECQTIVQNALRAIVTQRYSNPSARPRHPNAILMAIGGYSGRISTNVIEVYDFRAACWHNVSHSLEHPCAHHGTAFLNGSVYCVGGVDRKEYFNSVRRFDLSLHTWQEVAPMYRRRSYVSVTVMNGCIYALGGYNGHTRHKTAEVYNPGANQWSLIAPMHEKRSEASCTNLHGKIYICGGFTGRDYLQSAECYNPETNQWTLIAPMSSRRSGVAVIAFADHVFAVGGCDGTIRLCTAEAYNPRTNTWHAVASMLTPRSQFGIEVINNRIFACGGFIGLRNTSNVEFYNGALNEWSEAPDMEIFRRGLSCCVVSGIPNLAEYVIPRDALALLHMDDREEDIVE